MADMGYGRPVVCVSLLQWKEDLAAYAAEVELLAALDFEFDEAALAAEMVVA